MKANRSKLIREAIGHATAKQEAQLKIALAADARAMTMCVACAGIAGVLVGVAAAVERQDASLPIAMMAFCLFLASCFAAWSARPIGFASPGQDFGTFSKDIEADRPVDGMLIELGYLLDQDAADNERRVSINARYLRFSMALAAAAPLLGLLVLIAG